MVAYWTPELAHGEQPASIPFERWKDAWSTGSFAQHPAGFEVFLPPARLPSADEYAEGDPYGVDAELSSPFHRARLDTAKRLTLAAAQGLSAPAVLDLGCGGGHLLARLAALIPTAQLVGLDYSLSAIAEARRVVPSAQLVVADALEPPFPSGTFDAVLCTNLWEHVDSPVALARSMHRVLKPGGQLVLSTPSRYRFQNLRRALRGRDMAFMSTMHVTEYSVGQVLEMLRFTQFELIEHVAPQVSRHMAGRPRRLITSLLETALRSVGSHHVLEPTVFVRARAAHGS